MRKIVIATALLCVLQTAWAQYSPSILSVDEASELPQKKVEHQSGSLVDTSQAAGLIFGGPPPNTELEVDGTIEASAFIGDGSMLTNLLIAGSPIENVIIVAKSGGDYTSISQALGSITDNASDNRYQINIGPGVYEERVVMKKFVDIVGSGPNLTNIIFPSGSALETLLTADSCELRDLSVINDGSGSNSFVLAIHNNGTSPLIKNVIARCFGGSFNYTIYSQNQANPTLVAVSIFAGEGSSAVGHYLFSSNAIHRRCAIDVMDDTNDNGIYMTHGGTDDYHLLLVNCIIEAGVRSLRLSSAFHVINAGSQFLGGGEINLNGGTIACVNCFNDVGVALNTSCQ